MCADNISGGLEPVFAFETVRSVNTPQGIEVQKLADHGHAVLGVKGRLSSQVTAAEHIAVLATAQRYVDSAVSKTINMDSRTMSWDEFKDIYRLSWESGCKGCTTFNAAGKRGALLTTEEDAACTIDPTTGRRECA